MAGGSASRCAARAPPRPGLASAIAGVTPGQAQAAGAPEFTMVPSRGLVGSFGGFGGQFNQHVFADISGPPPNLPGLEAKVLALGPRYVRVFFNNSEWTFPDRMASFVRTVQLANRAEATIEVAWQGGTFAFGMQNMPRFADVLTDLLEHQGIAGPLWVSLYNEPNSGLLSLPQYEQTYRLLDAELRARGVRDRIHFMGGGILAATSGLGQSQADWYWYMATHMGDLLDALGAAHLLGLLGHPEDRAAAERGAEDLRGDSRTAPAPALRDGVRRPRPPNLRGRAHLRARFLPGRRRDRGDDEGCVPGGVAHDPGHSAQLRRGGQVGPLRRDLRHRDAGLLRDRAGRRRLDDPPSLPPVAADDADGEPGRRRASSMSSRPPEPT